MTNYAFNMQIRKVDVTPPEILVLSRSRAVSDKKCCMYMSGLRPLVHGTSARLSTSIIHLRPLHSKICSLRTTLSTQVLPQVTPLHSHTSKHRLQPLTSFKTALNRLQSIQSQTRSLTMSSSIPKTMRAVDIKNGKGPVEAMFVSHTSRLPSPINL